jgi:hypothetical protein
MDGRNLSPRTRGSTGRFVGWPVVVAWVDHQPADAPPGWLPTRPWPPPGVESRPGRAAVRRHADSTFELIEQGPIPDRPGIGPDLHFRGRVAGIRTRDLLTPRRRLVNHSRTPTPLTWVCVVRWTIGVHGERLQMPHYLPHWVTGHCKARPRRLIHGDGQTADRSTRPAPQANGSVSTEHPAPADESPVYPKPRPTPGFVR